MPRSSIPVEVLIAQLHDSDWTTRCDAARLLGSSGDPRAAALTLPWCGEERALESLIPLLQDPDATVRIAATWAANALQKVIFYRKQSGQ